jgi:DNA-binding response OmpR family regulator
MTAPLRVLVADDDRTTTMILAAALQRWNCEVTVAADGAAAWEFLTTRRPGMAILDWMMPSVDGPTLCRQIREHEDLAGMYVLLLTSRGSRADLVAGLDAGADDYLTKPVDREELRARVHVGMRVATLQTRLQERVGELQAALEQVTRLEGLLPICSYCKNIRSEGDTWQQMEQYIAEHSDAEFSHSICPTCYERVKLDFESGG